MGCHWMNQERRTILYHSTMMMVIDGNDDNKCTYSDDDDDDDVVVRPICFGDHLNSIVQMFMMEQKYFPSKTQVSQQLFVASIHFNSAEPVLQPQRLQNDGAFDAKSSNLIEIR